MTEPLGEDALHDIDAEPVAGSDRAGPGLPPPTAVESLVSALLDSGPEVAEHVVRAAQELLLAAQVLVDAADRAVREQQDVRAARAADAEGATPPVRHLDVAE
jgi:hypothetical protein